MILTLSKCLRAYRYISDPHTHYGYLQVATRPVPAFVPELYAGRRSDLQEFALRFRLLLFGTMNARGVSGLTTKLRSPRHIVRLFVVFIPAPVILRTVICGTDVRGSVTARSDFEGHKPSNPLTRLNFAQTRDSP